MTGGERLEQDRAFVLGVLAGAVAAETHPWAFDEDVVLFSIWRVEHDDPAWLLPTGERSSCACLTPGCCCSTAMGSRPRSARCSVPNRRDQTRSAGTPLRY